MKNSPINRFSATFLIVVGLFILSFSVVSAITWDNIDYYKLDESSGEVIDSVGNYNGVNQGATPSASGKLNTAYSFDGSNDYIQFDTNVVPAGTGSISMWVNFSDNVTEVIFATGTAAGATPWTLFGLYGSELAIRNSDTSQQTASGFVPLENTWYHIVYTSDGANSDIYVNGVNQTTTGTEGLWFDDLSFDTASLGALDRATDYGNLDGIIDEFGIWDRVLTQTEITELYNGGSGLAYGGVSSNPTVTLEYPTNNTTISDVGSNFTLSGNNISAFSANWTNVTFTIWNGTDALFNSTTVNFADNDTFNETLFIDSFTLDNYTWNGYACFDNVTGTFCQWAANNFTFNVVPFSTVAESYSPSVLEGDTETFTINLSVITTERLSTVNFVYDGTAYSVAATEYDTNIYYMKKTLPIPLVSADTNKSFYWSVRLESGLISNSTTHNQTIIDFAIDNCSVYTNNLLNFSMVDEDSQVVLNGTTQKTSIKIDMELSTVDDTKSIINFSTFFNQTNPATVCISDALANSTLRMDAVVEYSSLNRFVEFYNIQNYSLKNTTQSQNITLYNLNSSNGQEFKITYKGQDFTPVTDLIIQIQRKYIDEGSYKVIEIPMSGSNGYTIAHLVPNDVVYTLVFIQDGTVLDIFRDVIAECQNPSITDCEINLNALISGSDLISLAEENDFFSTLTYNKNTKTVSSTYGITSGVSSFVSLNVSLFDNYGNTVACSDGLIAAGGTLSCSVPTNYQNYTLTAKVIYDGEVRRSGIISQTSSPQTVYGGVLIFMTILMLMFIFGISISDSPTITGIFIILGSLLLVGLNMVYSTKWIGAGATILWFIVAIIIVIIKGGSKR